MPRPSLQSRNFVVGCRMPFLDGEALEFCCIPRGLASEGPSIGSGPKHVLSVWNRPNDAGVSQRFVLRAALAPWTVPWTCRLPAADLSVLCDFPSLRVSTFLPLDMKPPFLPSKRVFILCCQS